MIVKAYLKIQLAIILFIFCNISQAMFIATDSTPVDRLTANVTSYIKENPSDANGYYILGRIQYMAFSNKATGVSMIDKGVDNLPEFPVYFDMSGISKVRIYNEAYLSAIHELSTNRSKDQRKFEMSEESQNRFLDLYQKKVKEQEESSMKNRVNIPDNNQLIQYVKEAIKNFHMAINMDPNNGLYHLGLASLLEQYTHYLEEIKLKEMPEELRDIILNNARDIYYIAYILSIVDDLKPQRKSSLGGFRERVSYEAGNAYIRMTELQKTISDSEKAKVLDVHQNIEKGVRQNTGIITPIVFSLEEYNSPIELLGQNLQVKYDLAGDGNSELWPWVKPTTGILVWNEDGKGSITSGRQMFGSVTWWLFFNDGYHALDCLDDNRDGALTGNELKGISAWFDVNSNGQSESAEIKSLDELGIVSISVKSTSTENGWPANKTGIKLNNGQTIATYDWIAQPIKESKN
jgi:hypothetical protein